MRAASRFSMLTLGLAMVLGLSSAAISRADDAPATAPATGTISGKVLDAAGNPAKGVHVSAYAIAAGDTGKGAGKGGKGKMPAAIATADTGDDGSYKLTAVPAGDVRVMAKTDTDSGRAKVTVVAGADAKADDIKLAPTPARGNGGGKKAPAAQ